MLLHQQQKHILMNYILYNVCVSSGKSDLFQIKTDFLHKKNQKQHKTCKKSVFIGNKSDFPDHTHTLYKI